MRVGRDIVLSEEGLELILTTGSHCEVESGEIVLRSPYCLFVGASLEKEPGDIKCALTIATAKKGCTTVLRGGMKY